jgi:hypothetical protein
VQSRKLLRAAAAGEQEGHKDQTKIHGFTIGARYRAGRRRPRTDCCSPYATDWICLSGSFNGKLRDELLNGEIFYTLKEAQIVIEKWRRYYNTVRPHSSLGYRPPAPEAILWPEPKPVAQMQALN